MISNIAEYIHNIYIYIHIALQETAQETGCASGLAFTGGRDYVSTWSGAQQHCHHGCCEPLISDGFTSFHMVSHWFTWFEGLVQVDFF